MPSRRKLAPVVGRDSLNSSREQEGSTVELDTTFGRVLGLGEGQKVGKMRESMRMSQADIDTVLGWNIHTP